MTSRTIVYGTQVLAYERVNADVARFQIVVDPAGSAVVRAPLDATDEDVDALVRRRARWIVQQQRYFEQFRPRTVPRRWMPGETHLYLGRQLRLRMGDSDAPENVRSTRGYLVCDGVLRDDAAGIERIVLAWYRAQAASIIPTRISRIGETLTRGLPLPRRVQIRRMATRWASMSPSGTLSVNPLLMRARLDEIDYVLVHEICHLVEPDHGAAFVALLSQRLPSWPARKQRLERLLA